MKVLGIAGSIRRESYNRALLDTARQLAPNGMNIDVFDLARVPLYNADLDTDAARPDEVVRLKAAIAAADTLLFVTPEYNYSVPGVLQNAIDWASRPGMKSVLAGKSAGIMGASTGAIGTARAQQQLKLVLMGTLSLVMPHAGVLVGQAKDKFDASGTLTHEPTRQFVAAYLQELETWTRRVAPSLP
jgi:chromate reductase, NAD(P)H dehydrogenase (quinone)